MSYRKATLAVMAMLLILAVFYGREALSYQDMRNRNSVGPGYYPLALAVVLAILAVISAVQTMARADRRIEIPNLPLVALTVILSGVFLLVWSQLDQFYAGGFALLLALIFLFDRTYTPGRIIRNVVVAVAVILFTWLLFGEFINIRF